MITSRHMCCAVLCVTFLSACGSGKNTSNHTVEVSPSTYSAELAVQHVNTDRAIKEGKVDTWIASPVYLDDDAILAIYRGPNPGQVGKQFQIRDSSLSGSDVSKIAWSRGESYNDVLLNMLRVTKTSDELIFPETPYAFAEFVFLTPTSPVTIKPKVPAAPIKVETGDTTHTIHVNLHQAPPAQATLPTKGPQSITPPRLSSSCRASLQHLGAPTAQGQRRHRVRSVAHRAHRR